MLERHRRMFLSIIFLYPATFVLSQYISSIYVEFGIGGLPAEYGFLDLYTPSRFQCAQYCYYYKLCKSLQYDKDNKLCQLNIMTTNETGFSYDLDNWAYTVKESISKSIAGACADHSCDIFSMCADIKGSPVCVETLRKDLECKLPFPVNYATPLSNSTSFPIGTTVHLACNSPMIGILEATCKPYNKWLLHRNRCIPDFCYDKFSKIANLNIFNYEIATHDGSLYHHAVLCDKQNGDWMVVQQRLADVEIPGPMDYEFPDDQFKTYWIDIEVLSKLTNYKEVILRVEFTVENDTTVYFAEYGRFSVLRSNWSNYSLSIGDYLGGNCGDGLSYQNGSVFKVMTNGRGGWWQGEDTECTNLNANGITGYLRWSTDCPGSDAKHWTWISWTTMKIKPVKRTGK